MALNVLIMLGILLSMNASATWGQPPNESVLPEKVAERGLDTLKRLVNEQNFREFGFEELREVEDAKLGPSVPVFYVPLTSLKEYKGKGDTRKLIEDARRRLYEVVASGQVRCLITFERGSDGWSATRF